MENRKAGDFKTFKEFVRARQRQVSDFHDVRYPLGLQQGFSYSFKEFKKEASSDGTGLFVVLPVFAVILAFLAAIYFTIKYYWDVSGGLIDYVSAFLVLFFAMSFKTFFLMFGFIWLVYFVPNIYLSEVHYADAKGRYFWEKGKKYCSNCIGLYHMAKAVVIIMLMFLSSFVFYESVVNLFNHAHPVVAQSIDFSFDYDDY